VGGTEHCEKVVGFWGTSKGSTIQKRKKRWGRKMVKVTKSEEGMGTRPGDGTLVGEKDHVKNREKSKKTGGDEKEKRVKQGGKKRPGIKHNKEKHWLIKEQNWGDQIAN